METHDFEWFDDKAAKVLAERKISFWDAARVFDDPQFIQLPDRDNLETRTKAVGLVDDQLLTVIFTEGREGRIRIITAWPSSTEETDDYFAQG